MLRTATLGLVLCLVLPVAALAASLTVPGLKQDSAAPVEVTADKLEVDQSTSIATFSGNVVMIQGEMKLSADQVEVTYVVPQAGGKGKIGQLLAKGNVLLTTPTEAAEAQQADYSLANSQIVMTGDVVMTQGANVISGQRITIDLKDGTALAEGRVTTTLQPDSAAP